MPLLCSACHHVIKRVNGLKEQAGTLAAYEDGAVTIRQGEKEVRFEKSEVAQVRLRVEF